MFRCSSSRACKAIQLQHGYKFQQKKKTLNITIRNVGGTAIDYDGPMTFQSCALYKLPIVSQQRFFVIKLSGHTAVFLYGGAMDSEGKSL